MQMGVVYVWSVASRHPTFVAIIIVTLVESASIFRSQIHTNQQSHQQTNEMKQTNKQTKNEKQTNKQTTKRQQKTTRQSNPSKKNRYIRERSLSVSLKDPQDRSGPRLDCLDGEITNGSTVGVSGDSRRVSGEDHSLL
jgi:hypothetical protein